MFVAYKKTRGILNSYKILSKFSSYEDAYYCIGNILWKENENFSWSYSCKYLHDGYDKSKIFIFGKTYIKKNNKCYKILEIKTKV